jgi:hypothetical protein
MYRSRLGSVTPSAKLPPDGKPQLAIGGIIAERVVRFPNGGERLIHRCQRLRFIYSRLGILRGHRAPSFAGGSATYLSQPPMPVAVPLLVIV